MGVKKLLITTAIFTAGYMVRGCSESPESLCGRLYKGVRASPAQYERVIDTTTRQMAALKAEVHWNHPAREDCIDPKYARLEWAEEGGRDFAYLRLSGPAKGAYLLRMAGSRPALERIVEVGPARSGPAPRVKEDTRFRKQDGFKDHEQDNEGPDGSN